MKALGDYIHSKGLKFGVYVSNGTNTCQGHVSSLLHEETDAQDFEEWGVDFLKYDYCNNNLVSTYAPEVDKISVNGTSYEAEDATLSGDAKVKTLDSSTAKVVTGIGNTVTSHSEGSGMAAKSVVDSYTSGTLQFSQVKVENAGNYTVTFSYINSDYNKRLANLYVNGSKTAVKVYFPGIKGDSSTIQTVAVKLKLKAGVNTIKMTNPLISVADRNEEQYSWMGKALRKYAPDVVYYLCDWGTGNPWTWTEQYAQMWRTTFDISDNWDSMINIADQNTALAQYSGTGRWNDPDSLEVGNGGMTTTEYTSHFSLWAIMAAPLIAGNDLTNMTEATKDILTNKEVIAVDQDSLGIQGTVLSTDADGNQIYTKKLANGDSAVLFLNRSNDTVTMSTTASKIGLKKSSTYNVRDLWAQKTFTTSGKITVTIPSHGCAMYRVSKTGKTYQPLINISLTSNSTLAVPDTSYSLSNTITNLGKNISNVKVTLSLPSGWTINDTTKSSATTSVSGIKTDGSNDALSWSYNVPSDAKAGTYNITEKITFNYDKKAGTITKILQVSVPTVVSAGTSGAANLTDSAWYYAKNGSSMMGSVAIQTDKSSSGSEIRSVE
jgi:alpha-galactosidase